MAVYRFKVTFEDYDDVSRDVEIRANQTFEDLHYAIHSYIGFDASKSASFFISDDHWKRGKEISNRDLRGGDKETVAPFRNSRLYDFIADPHQKILYQFDPLEKWSFHIELVKILPGEEFGVIYPRCVKSIGEAPKQYPVIAASAIPPPEDFDESAVEPLLAAEAEAEEDVEEETETEVAVGIEEDEIPEGIEEHEPSEDEIGELPGEVVDEEPQDDEEL